MLFSYKLFIFLYILYIELLFFGKFDFVVSNFFVIYLFLKWNLLDGNLILNYYKIVVDGYQQQIFGNILEIYWNKKLMFGIFYNVIIIIVSYGGIFSGLLNGIVESNFYIEMIIIDKSKLSIYCMYKYWLNLFLFIKL